MSDEPRWLRLLMNFWGITLVLLAFWGAFMLAAWVTVALNGNVYIGGFIGVGVFGLALTASIALRERWVAQTKPLSEHPGPHDTATEPARAEQEKPVPRGVGGG